MSECVVRMEMPKDCARCPCGHSDWIWGDDDKEKMVWFCGIDHDSENERHYQLETEFGSRPSFCPILSALPENHGRLVDADKLNRKRKYQFKVEGGTFPKSDWFIRANDLFGAQTIVPATEGGNHEAD